jgi:hypothetical protein
MAMEGEMVELIDEVTHKGFLIYHITSPCRSGSYMFIRERERVASPFRPQPAIPQHSILWDIFSLGRVSILLLVWHFFRIPFPAKGGATAAGQT